MTDEDIKAGLLGWFLSAKNFGWDDNRAISYLKLFIGVLEASKLTKALSAKELEALLSAKSGRKS